MISSQRSPLWPYLAVLTTLFLLSLAVPRGWQQESESDQWQPTARLHARARQSSAAAAVAIVRPTTENIAAPLPWSSAGGQDQWISASEPATSEDTTASDIIGPIAETVAKKIADFRRFNALKNSTEQAPETVGNNANSNAQKPQQWTEQQRANAITSSYWPAPKSLFNQLDRLASQDDDCRGWVEQVEDLCLKLCQTSPGDPNQAVKIVQQLETLEQQVGTLDHTLKSDKAAADFRRAHYALRRRLALWNVAFGAEERTDVYADVPSADVRRTQLSRALTDAQDWIRSLPYADAWQKYLLLDEIQQLTDANQQISSEDAQRVARNTLNRLLPAQMSDAQRRVLEDKTLTALADQLRLWANEAVDVHDVLANIEQYESTGLPSDARNVATALRRMKCSAQEQDRQMAKELDEYYRNANIRIALTSGFFNRLAPEQPVANGVVNDTILGATVNGSSKTNSKLSVKLIPDAKRLHFWIDTEGTVDSDTVSSSGPATFSHNGRSTFLVHKAVVLDEKGLGIADAVAGSRFQHAIDRHEHVVRRPADFRANYPQHCNFAARCDARRRRSRDGWQGGCRSHEERECGSERTFDRGRSRRCVKTCGIRSRTWAWRRNRFR